MKVIPDYLEANVLSSLDSMNGLCGKMDDTQSKSILFTYEEISMMSMDGIYYNPNDPSLVCDSSVSPLGSSNSDDSGPIENACVLGKQLKAIFAYSNDCPNERKRLLINVLERVDFSQQELNKYLFWDNDKAYTRNLVLTDSKNYSLLLLCWNAGRESTIHNHPCERCYVKTLIGCIKESRYRIVDDDIILYDRKFLTEGQIGYMSDDLGLHRIGNPMTDMGSVSLHLYTPPFSTCKIWSNDGPKQLDKYTYGKIGFFSVFGIRTPALEGKPGKQSQLMKELTHKVKLIV